MDVGATVREIVWDVAEVAAPEEVWLLDGMRGWDDERIGRALRGRRRGGPVRFGVSDVAPFVVPLVWMIVEQLSDHATGRVVGSVADRAGARIRRSLRGRSARPPTVPPVDAETLRRVRRQVVEQAMAAGFDARRAESLADEVVDRLRRVGDDPEAP